ncbi:MAG: bifunctional nuclease family protein [Verrucomicrobiaceae bacterium]|nr:bifunctional nuclease family protein [Verrucomicrobiaceae bacterium]
MNNQVQQVQVRAVIPLDGSYALFLGNAQKTFVIYIDEQVGVAISMFMRSTPKERPLTHDLLATVMMAFGAKVERVVINDMNGKVFYARLILAAENQLHSKKLIELDARPSDSIAMAVQQNAPIYVADTVWNEVPDVTNALEEIEARTAQSQSDTDGDDHDDLEGLFSEDDEDEDEDDDFEDEDDFDDDDDEEDDFDDEDDDDEEGEDNGGSRRS